MNLQDKLYNEQLKELERKYEIEKRHASEDKNLLVHGCFNLDTGEIIDYDGSYLFTGDESSSIEKIGRAISKEAMGTDIRTKLLKLHDRSFLRKCFEEGKTEFSLEYQRTLSNGKCIWVCTTLHLLRDPMGVDLLAFEYCYNVNIKKTMNILMEFAVNDDYDLMGFVNMQDGMCVMAYGKDSYNPKGENILEDDYQKSLMDFASNAVVKEEKDHYLELADLNHVAHYLESHDNLEFYFNIQKQGENIRAKKVRYMKYQHDEKSIIFIQSDITQLIQEQKKNQQILERALKEAEVASIAKTSFLSQMSHEIRTPMNAIIGMTKLAQQTDCIQEKNHYLEQIDASSQYLLGIINDILDMSRIESGKLELHPQWIDGCKVVMDCVEMLRPAMEKKHLKFIYPKLMHNNKLRFFLDPLRIQQIYMNLLNNAVKFTPEGGTIEMKMKNVSHNNHAGVDRIQIIDTGCGMSQEFLTRVFQPFEMEENEFSPSVQGTGLGLALVKAYITKMGGKIWVESELGKGSVFTFELPYEAAFSEENERVLPQTKNLELAGKTILLVDDHPLNREIARKLLENKKVKVVTAVDGQDACRIFSEEPANFFDAILMDIRMPKLNGLQATRRIRSMERADAKVVPIIAMTANAFDEDVQKSINAGMNAHLAKPIEPEKLMKVLGEQIHLIRE